METTINKSRLMKRAWSIYRSNNAWSDKFSSSLCRAWEIEKATIAHEARKAAEATEKARLATIASENQNTAIEYNELFHASMIAYYRDARPCQYFGD